MPAPVGASPDAAPAVPEGVRPEPIQGLPGLGRCLLFDHTATVERGSRVKAYGKDGPTAYYSHRTIRSKNKVAKDWGFLPFRGFKVWLDNAKYEREMKTLYRRYVEVSPAVKAALEKKAKTSATKGKTK